MRISELSGATGISVATIKYYLREGLLAPGAPKGRNQADYDERHVHRLRLIRALLEVGGLGVAAARGVLDAVDDPDLAMHDLLGVAHRALGPPADRGTVPGDVVQARLEVDGLLAALDWEVDPGHPARRALAGALVALRRLGLDHPVDVFRPYAEVADLLAAGELRTIPTRSRAEAVEGVVVGTIVFEAALVALRRLAQARHSALRFAASAPVAGPRLDRRPGPR